MWISADESDVISATLLPKLKKTWRAHEDLLFEAITLQVNALTLVTLPADGECTC